DVPGASGSAATGINDAGLIVGNQVDSDGVFHGFLLSGGVYTTLDVPGAIGTRANGINDAGLIVGIYGSEGALPRIAGADPCNGYVAPAPASVSPEPASIVLFAIGTIGMLAYGWRHQKQVADCRPKTVLSATSST